MVDEVKDRRPIQAREKVWAKKMAAYLQQHGATPNGISLFSIVCALLAALFLFFAFTVDIFLLRIFLFLCAALMIQGRLICNLLDGMVAIEGGLRSAVGAVYNELPDRVSDSVIFVAVGYGVESYYTYAPALGWCAAFMAVMTAYIRLLGGSTGLPQKFLGPMAKQHRMALLTGASIVSAFLPLSWSMFLFTIALWIVTIGAFITTCYRARVLMFDLNKRGLQ